MRKILSRLSEASQHPFAIGFDPDLKHLPTPLTQDFDHTQIDKLLTKWASCVFESLKTKTNIVKLQSAYFEVFGAQGFSALAEVVKIAKTHNLFVILDAKRGDIDSTMTAYGKTAFDMLGADALTITPWMGIDVIQALLPWLKKDKGVYVVWLSSNPSGRKIQEQRLETGKSLCQSLWYDIQEWAKIHSVENSIGYVLGATDIPDWVSFSKDISNQSFLMPGVGAQGAKIDTNLRGFIQKNPTSTLPISRGILVPDKDRNIANWDQYQAAIEKQFDRYLDEWKTLI